MTAFRDDEIHAGVFAARTPDKPAIIMADDGRVITFAEYEALSNQAAHLFRAAGLERGDRIAIFMENHALYLPLAWGGLRAGLRVTAIATHLSPSETDYILDNSDARVLLTSARMADRAAAVSAAGIAASARFMADVPAAGFVSLDQALAAQPSTPITDQSEGVEMLYSSGTTGLPKAIKKPLPETPFGIPPPATRSFIELYGVDDTTVYLHPAPLYHAAPLAGHLRVLRYGGTCVVMQRFDAERSLALIEEHGATHSQWVPTHFVRLLALPEAVRHHYDLTTHRMAIHAAAPCPIDIKQRMIDWWGPIVREYYGGSEGNGYVTIGSHEWLARPGSVGRAVTGILRICDDDGNEVPVGTEGTIYFENGPQFAYHKAPEKTAAAHNARGWSTLGDVGYIDHEGYLFLTDRKAFMIVSGGVNIYPQEAENLLVTHPKVIDVAVFGVPNAEFGEEVKAVVQPIDIADAGPELEAELLAFCRARLSHVKCPRSIDFLARLPRQENGKLYKRQLRATYWLAPDGKAG